MYLLDANVFISAKRRFYRFKVVPGFWDWLHQANMSREVASVVSVQKELEAGGDDLTEWVKHHKSLFEIPARKFVESSTELAQWVVKGEYTQVAQHQFLAAADFELVAQALALGATVVTEERPQPGSRKRVLISDACDAMGVQWTDPFTMLERCGAKFVLAPESDASLFGSMSCPK